MGEDEEPSPYATRITGVALLRAPSDDNDSQSAGNGSPRGGSPGSGNGGSGDGPPPPSPRRRWRRRERYPRHKQQLHVAKLIDLLIRVHKLTDIVREHRIYIFWNEMNDPKIAKNTHPVAFSNGVLQVHARSSSWVHESRFFREKMIEQINRSVGAPRLLSDIRFSLSTPRRGEPVDHDLLPRIRREEEERRLPPRQPPPTVSIADQERICSETSAVEDADLRATIERVRLRWNR